MGFLACPFCFISRRGRKEATTFRLCLKYPRRLSVFLGNMRVARHRGFGVRVSDSVHDNLYVKQWLLDGRWGSN